MEGTPVGAYRDQPAQTRWGFVSSVHLACYVSVRSLLASSSVRRRGWRPEDHANAESISPRRRMAARALYAVSQSVCGWPGMSGQAADLHAVPCGGHGPYCATHPPGGLSTGTFAQPGTSSIAWPCHAPAPTDGRPGFSGRWQCGHGPPPMHPWSSAVPSQWRCSGNASAIPNMGW